MGIYFQCEMFHMRNIEGWDLIPRDEGLLILMRRENLDACWGIEQITVGWNLEYLRRTRRDTLEGKLFTPSASFGPVYSGIFGGDETGCDRVTEVTKTG